MTVEVDENAIVPRQILDAAADALEQCGEAETADMLRGSQAGLAEALIEVVREAVEASGSPDALRGYRAGTRVGAMEAAVEVRRVLRHFTDRHGKVRAWRVRDALDREWERRAAS